MLECPMYNPSKDKFKLLFKKVILDSLESFFQEDHQVDISFYLTEATALRHSRDISQFDVTLYF